MRAGRLGQAVEGLGGQRGVCVGPEEHVQRQLAHAGVAGVWVAEVVRSGLSLLEGVFAAACEAASAARAVAAAWAVPAAVAEVFEVEEAVQVVEHLVAVLVLADGFEVLAEELLSEAYLEERFGPRVSAVVVQQRLHDVVSDRVRRDDDQVFAVREVLAERGHEVFHAVLDEALEDVRAVLLEDELGDPRLESGERSVLLANDRLGLDEADLGEDVLQHVVAVHVADDVGGVLADRVDELFLREAERTLNSGVQWSMQRWITQQPCLWFASILKRSRISW